MMLAVALVVLMPPAPLDREPSRPYAVHYVSQAVIEERCGGSLDLQVRRLTHPDAYALGCTNPVTSDIWIDEALPPPVRAEVLRHEKGHINGWRHGGSDSQPHRAM